MAIFANQSELQRQLDALASHAVVSDPAVWANPLNTSTSNHISSLCANSKSASVIATPTNQLFYANLRVVKAENGYIVEVTSGSKLTTHIAVDIAQVRDIILAQMTIAQLEK